MKKRVLISVLLAMILAAVLFGVSLWHAADRLLDAENRGHTYRNFFIVVETYTQQTNEFPTSLDDLLSIEIGLGYEGVRWPEDANLIADLIQPNFDIVPSSENLNVFAPDYESKADWAASDCAFYWERILDHLNGND